MSLSSFRMMIAMAASELDETNGKDRGAQECTPLTPECVNFFVLFFFFTLGIRSIVNYFLKVLYNVKSAR